jgi:hypothetical protein
VRGVILRPVRAPRLFFGVEVIEVAAKLIKPVDRGQILVAIAKMVLAELPGGITQRLQSLS